MYDYIEPKYSDKSKLCYMDTDSSIAHTKTDDIYKDIAGHVASRSDTSIYELDRLVPIGKKLKSYMDNERWIRKLNHLKSCQIMPKNIQLFKRQQWRI